MGFTLEIHDHVDICDWVVCVVHEAGCKCPGICRYAENESSDPCPVALRADVGDDVFAVPGRVREIWATLEDHQLVFARCVERVPMAPAPQVTGREAIGHRLEVHQHDDWVQAMLWPPGCDCGYCSVSDDCTVLWSWTLDDDLDTAWAQAAHIWPFDLHPHLEDCHCMFMQRLMLSLLEDEADEATAVQVRAMTRKATEQGHWFGLGRTTE